jgi:adenylate cyclase
VTRAIRTETKEAMYVTAAPLDTMDWILCTVVPASDFFGYIYTSTRLMLLAVAALVVIATLVSLLVSSYILSGPIGRLTRKIERLARLRLDDTPYERSSIREIQEISDSIQRMEVALASFRKYVPADLVSDLLAKGRAATLSWEERDLSVIYTDIHRFRRQTRDLSPEEINVQFRAYLEAVTASVVENGGTVDKYMGDRVLAFWGAPDEMPDHPVHACRAALACRRRIAELNAAWEKEGRPVLPTTIGVNSGRMLVGNMGTEHRMSYSVIGDAVDLALRFAVSGQQFGLPILAGQTTREAVGDAFLFRPIDMLGGGEESAGEEGGGSVVFELAGLPTDDFYEEKNFLCSEFRIAFRAYQEHDFKAALRKFMEIRQRFPDDGPTQVYIDRCSRLRKESPGPNWEALVRTDSEIFDTIESDARHDAR